LPVGTYDMTFTNHGRNPDGSHSRRSTRSDRPEPQSASRSSESCLPTPVSPPRRRSSPPPVLASLLLGAVCDRRRRKPRPDALVAARRANGVTLPG
jgi:hypothetical protein